MLGKQADLLKALVSAANGWRATGTSAGVNVISIGVVFPDGRNVVMSWDDGNADWSIDT